MRPGLRRTLTASAIAVWAALVAAGLWDLGSYSATAGRAAEPPQQWPAEVELARAPGQPTLLLFLHPRCSCSRASLEQLARLLAGSRAAPRVHVLFLLPAGRAAEWVVTDLWHGAAALPGVLVHADHDGRLARRFGAATSGQALLFDVPGKLVFAGGLTIARGHDGDNPGAAALAAWLGGDEASRQSVAPVFGCPLAEEEGR